MFQFHYKFFKFDNTIDYYIVLKLENQINRKDYYEQLKEILKYSHYAYKIENVIF